MTEEINRILEEVNEWPLADLEELESQLHGVILGVRDDEKKLAGVPEHAEQGDEIPDRNTV